MINSLISLDILNTKTQPLLLVFAQPNSSNGAKFMNMVDYLDYRSGDKLDIYIAGYDEFTGFNMQNFVRLVEELEHKTGWSYSGETEFIYISYDKQKPICTFHNIDQLERNNQKVSIYTLLESIIRGE